MSHPVYVKYSPIEPQITSAFCKSKSYKPWLFFSEIWFKKLILQNWFPETVLEKRFLAGVISIYFTYIQ